MEFPHDYSPQTWGSWDVRCLNAVMKVPEMVEVRVLVYDKLKRTIVDEMRWESLVVFGGHHLDGRYSDITLKCGEAVFRFEFAAFEDGDGFVYKITPNQPAPHLCFFVAGLLRWNKPGQVEKCEDHLVLRAGGKEFNITVIGEPQSLPINTTYQGLLVDGGAPVYIRCNHTMNAVEMDTLLSAREEEWAAQALRGGGLLQDAPQAMVKGILWNTIYEAIKGRYCTPVTREWCILKPERPFFGSYVLFTWDTSFNALLAGAQDESLAYRQIYSLIEEMTEENIPCTNSEVSVYAERSQPPITSYCALKLYHQFGRLDFIQAVYEPLMVQHRWWFKYRDGNGDGLLEWGTNLEITHDDFAGYLGEAKSESGLDNSPMYDETCFNPQTHTMELADVGLNCLYALDCWSLAAMARLLGREEEAAALIVEYEVMKDRINRELWNESLGIYCNRHWDGHFSTILGPTCFYPLLAGIASPAQAERMVHEHLLNEAEFWGEFVLPASPKNHPSFTDNDYWRGRIWAPTNYLVAEGIKWAGFSEVADTFARKSLNLFLQEWRTENHIHENYHAITGEGDDVSNADPVYTWGGLLAYLAVSTFIEVLPEGGLRMGNLSGDEATVENYPYQGSCFSVKSGRGLEVRQDGQVLLQTDVPARVVCSWQEGGKLIIHAESCQAGSIKLTPRAGLGEFIISSNGLPPRVLSTSVGVCTVNL